MNPKLQLIFAWNFNVAASAAVSVSVALYVWPTYSSCKNSITEKKKRKINWETALDAAKIDKRDTDTDTQSNQKRGKPRLPQLGTISTWDALRSARSWSSRDMERNRNRNQIPRRSRTDTLACTHFHAHFPFTWSHIRNVSGTRNPATTINSPGPSSIPSRVGCLGLFLHAETLSMTPASMRVRTWCNQNVINNAIK